MRARIWFDAFYMWCDPPIDTDLAQIQESAESLGCTRWTSQVPAT